MPALPSAAGATALSNCRDLLVACGLSLALLTCAVAQTGPQPAEQSEAKPVGKAPPDGSAGKADDNAGKAGEKTADDEAARPVRLPELGGDPMERLVDEIARNMKTIEALLNRRDTGGQCQELQGQTVQKIDELIEELQKRSSSSSSSSCSSGQPQQGQQGQPKDQARSESQRQLEEQAGQHNKQGQSAKDPNSPEKVPNNQTREVARPAPESSGELHDRTGVGRWGRLPGKVVEQMYDNGKRKLPERYRVLLEEYFRRLPLAEGQ